MTSTDLVAVALGKLDKSLAKSSLDQLVQARTRRSLLLVDASGSMADYISTGERKIDALRKVVTTLRDSHPVPVAAFFGVRGAANGHSGAARGVARRVEVVDVVPEPSGGTPLDAAIDFGAAQGATHLVVVTDGYPNNADAALQSARTFGGPVDVFYIGNGNDQGSAFCAALAKSTGGTFGLTDLVGAPKVLAGRILLALGDGSETI